jgi:hypothetical protein
MHRPVKHGALVMSTASFTGSPWVPRHRPTSKPNAKLRLIFKIRRDAQSRQAPPPTLPRLAWETPPPIVHYDAPVVPAVTKSKPGRGPREGTWNSKAIGKSKPSDARTPYSTAQLRKMDRKFHQAMERALSAGSSAAEIARRRAPARPPPAGRRRHRARPGRA